MNPTKFADADVIYEWSLVKVGDGAEILPVPLGRRQRRVVLQAADHVEDGVLGEHQLEESVLVQQEDVLEDLVKVVQALRVLQVLGHPALDAIQLVFRNISVHIWDKFWDNFSASDISRSFKHDLGFGGMFWNKKVSIELPP